MEPPAPAPVVAEPPAVEPPVPAPPAAQTAANLDSAIISSEGDVELMDLGSGSMMGAVETQRRKRSSDETDCPSWAKRLCIRVLEASNITHHPVPLIDPIYSEDVVATTAQQMYAYFDKTTFYEVAPTTNNLVELVDAKLYHMHHTNNRLMSEVAHTAAENTQHQIDKRAMEAKIAALQQKVNHLKTEVANLLDNSDTLIKASESVTNAAIAHKKRVESLAVMLMK